MIRRTLVATVSALLLLVLVAGTTLGARQVFVFSTLLTGEAERPGPGDPDAIGHAVIMTEPANDRLCWVVSWTKIDGTVFASHIHGTADTEHPAPVLLPLFMGESFGGTGIDQGCVEGPDVGTLIDAIIANPQLYYVNVHSLPNFAPGAIRGQLG